MKIRIIILIVLCAFGEANAQLRYGSVFTDNMVIQQNTDVRIWGTSSSVSKVNVVASWAVQDTLKTERLACPGKKIEGFRIAGEDGVFVDAEAKIAGNQVQVWAKSVKAPVSVRYCFDDCTFGNLKSSKGLPVAPFRTDK